MTKFLPIVVVLLITFTAVVKLSNLTSSTTRNSAENQAEGASDSAKLEVYEAPDNELLGDGEAADKVPTKTFKQNGNTYTSQNFDEKVVMKGTYKLSTYEVEFTISLPKAGGAISGSLSGTCEGTISGNASSQNENNTASINGSYSGNCKPIPTLGFKAPMSGDFTGKVFYDEGKAAISVTNKEPIAPGINYFEMFF